MKRKGFFYLSSNEVEAAIQWYQEQGYKIYTLPNNMISRDDFFNGVRATLPLNPPVQTNTVWDALSDSLWSGLDALYESHDALKSRQYEVSEKNILIVWPDAYKMSNHDGSLEMVNDIFSTLSDELYSENQKFGIEFNLVILAVA